MSESELEGLVVIRWKGVLSASVEVQQTLHARTGGVGTSPNTALGMQGLADAVAAAWSAAGGFQDILSAAYTLQSVEVQDLSPEALATAVSPVNLAGAVAGDAAPSGAALVITTRTAQAGRAYRGRMYLGGLPQASPASGGLSWDSAVVTAAQSAAEDLHIAIETASPTEYGPVVWHRPPAEDRPDTPELADTTTGITNYVARADIHYQRRRAFGFGS